MEIDPNTLNIILNVISSGFTSLIAISGHKIGKLLIGKDLLDKWEIDKTALQPVLQKAIKNVAENVQWSGNPREEIISLFLLSPEVEEIIRQVYCTKLLKHNDQKNIDLIRKTFYSMLLLFINSYLTLNKAEEENLADAANFLFDALIDGSNLILERAIDVGILAAHEAKSSFRHNILLDEVAAIQKKLDFLTSKQQSNINTILAFEKKYRQQVNSRHKNITPPYLDIAKKVHIDKIYIQPHFFIYSNETININSNKDSKKPETIKILEFLSGVYRAVVLGNPGGGKSTLALKLCHELTASNTKLTFAGKKQITPILVILREYGAEKKFRNCSILQFIEGKANANYQVQPPLEAFEYLLISGRAFVIFDGLDELLDTAYRQEITSDVESFCNLYPSVPVLVTSREVGYEQSPLDREKFSVFRLAPFDTDQVQEYVKKWFSIGYKELSIDQREYKTITFLKESRLVTDLCSNPLMLALLCVIYRGENYIPRNRPDVYEKCAIMLFERWDKSRGIHTNLSIDWHIRPMMEYLAYWIFTDERLRGGVTEEELTIKATEYIYEWIFDNTIQAEKIAQEFINFCTGRAWVFTDTGTKKEGDKLFQFTHTTFLEYFAASYLVRTCRTPQALLKVLQPKIAKREWDVMAQLSFQLQNKKIAGAGDELLTSLINHSRQANVNAAWNFLTFAVRCLEFMVPRPKVIREIIKVYFDHVLIKAPQWYNKKKSSQISFETNVRTSLRSLASIILSKSIESASIITEYVEEKVINAVNNGNDIEAALMLEIGVYTNQDNIFTKCINRIEGLYPIYFWLCFEAVDLNKLSIVNLVKWYDIKGIFHTQNGLLNTRVSLGQLIVRRVLDAPHSPSFSSWVKDHIDIFNELGPILLDHRPPYLILPSDDEIDVFNTWWYDVEFFPEKQIIKSLSLKPDAYFTAFILFSILMEAQNLALPKKREIGVKQIITTVKTSNCLFFSSIRWTFCARYEPVAEEKIQKELEKCGFTEPQQDLIWKWIRRELDFVQTTAE